MNNKYLIFILLFAFVIGFTETNAQNRVHRDVIGSGGKLMTSPKGDVKLNGTITETMTGRTEKLPIKHWQGFWYAADIDPQVITLMWPDTSAKIGDTITVFMTREFQEKPRGFNDFTFETYLKFHRKILKPIGEGFEVEFVGDTAILKMYGNITMNNNIADSIKFLVKLGTTDRSFLNFGMPTTSSTRRKTDFLYRNGTILVEDICRDRFVDYADENILENVWPNPAKEDISVKVKISSETRVQIAVLDLNGRLSQILYNGVLKAGYYTLESHLNDLASGNYSVILKTESSFDSKQITIVK